MGWCWEKVSSLGQTACTAARRPKQSPNSGLEDHLEEQTECKVMAKLVVKGLLSFDV